jgi:hypothetical protein
MKKLVLGVSGVGLGPNYSYVRTATGIGFKLCLIGPLTGF